MTAHRKKLITTGYVLAIWLGLACLAYGSALANFESWRTPNFSRLDVLRGRIVSIQPGFITRFKTDQIATEYLIPKIFLNPALDQGVGYYLRVGQEVILKGTSQGVVLDLLINPGTPYAKPVVEWGTAVSKYAEFIDSQALLARSYRILGLFFLLVLPGAHLGYPRLALIARESMMRRV